MRHENNMLKFVTSRMSYSVDNERICTNADQKLCSLHLFHRHRYHQRALVSGIELIGVFFLLQQISHYVDTPLASRYAHGREFLF
jgi:hypothetical protein